MLPAEEHRDRRQRGRALDRLGPGGRLKGDLGRVYHGHYAIILHILQHVCSVRFPFKSKEVDLTPSLALPDMRQPFVYYPSGLHLLQLDGGMGPGYHARLGYAILGDIERSLELILVLDVVVQMEQDPFRDCEFTGQSLHPCGSRNQKWAI